MLAAPPPTEYHKQERLKWARAILDKKTYKLKQTAWTDEKRFNLDGPDSFQHYWVDLRRDSPIMSRRQNGGGGLMFWGCFSHNGPLILHEVSGRMNAQSYIEVLEEFLCSLGRGKSSLLCSFTTR